MARCSEGRLRCRRVLGQGGNEVLDAEDECAPTITSTAAWTAIAAGVTMRLHVLVPLTATPEALALMELLRYRRC
jgi:hypothetical protein